MAPVKSRQGTTQPEYEAGEKQVIFREQQDSYTHFPSLGQLGIPAGCNMASSIHRDSDDSRRLNNLILYFVPMAEGLLNDTWALVTGNKTADRGAEFTAKAAEFLPQLTEISFRIIDKKIKFDTEHNLQNSYHQAYEDIKDQNQSITAWLESRKRADLFEDAWLSGDSDSVILFDLQAKAMRKRCRELARDELVGRLHLADSTGRMTAYVREYAQATVELMVLNYTLNSGEMASQELQRQHLDALFLEAAERLGLA